jgi:hypothetical protein
MNTRLLAAAVLALSAAFLSGCASETMETHGDTIQLFHTGLEKPGRGGVVRYLSNGPALFKRLRRADAVKKMKAFCPSGYVITAEGPRSKFGAAMPIGPKVSVELDQYWYIAFQCSGS